MTKSDGKSLQARRDARAAEIESALRAELLARASQRQGGHYSLCLSKWKGSSLTVFSYGAYQPQEYSERNSSLIVYYDKDLKEDRYFSSGREVKRPEYEALAEEYLKVLSQESACKKVDPIATIRELLEVGERPKAKRMASQEIGANNLSGPSRVGFTTYWLGRRVLTQADQAELEREIEALKLGIDVPNLS